MIKKNIQTLCLYIACILPCLSFAQTVLFSDDFGQSTVRATADYMPDVSDNGYYLGEAYDSSISQSDVYNMTSIDNGYYAVIDPSYIYEGVHPGALGYYFWTQSYDGNPGSATYTDDHTSGDTNGAVLVVNGSTNLYDFYKRPVTLETTKTYKLTYWIYGVNESVLIPHLLVTDYEDTDGDEELGETPTGTVWDDAIASWNGNLKQWIQKTFYIQFDEASDDLDCNTMLANIVLRNGYGNDGGNDFYIDDIQLEETSSIPSGTDDMYVLTMETCGESSSDTSGGGGGPPTPPGFNIECMPVNRNTRSHLN